MKDFFIKAYEIVEKIPEGKVMTYGQIAALLGQPRNARVVGWAMRAAPDNRNLPCHRVVNRNGEMSPREVFGGVEVQQALLEREGIIIRNNRIQDLVKYLWDGNVISK